MSLIQPWHLAVYAKPTCPVHDRHEIINGNKCRVLDIAAQNLVEPFPNSFDVAYQQLDALDGLFIERDGSFVRRGHGQQEPTWQIDGLLYDRNDQVWHLELKGFCDQLSFEHLLVAIGWPACQVVIRSINNAQSVEYSEFRLLNWQNQV